MVMDVGITDARESRLYWRQRELLVRRFINRVGVAREVVEGYNNELSVGASRLIELAESDVANCEVFVADAEALIEELKGGKCG